MARTSNSIYNGSAAYDLYRYNGSAAQQRTYGTAAPQVERRRLPEEVVVPQIERRVKVKAAVAPFDYDQQETGTKTDSVADEIAANLEALVGTADEPAPKAEPRHPINDTTTSKFANLQFGRNYEHGTNR